MAIVFFIIIVKVRYEYLEHLLYLSFKFNDVFSVKREGTYNLLMTFLAFVSVNKTLTFSKKSKLPCTNKFRGNLKLYNHQISYLVRKAVLKNIIET